MNVFFCDGCEKEHPIRTQRYNRLGHDFDICQSHYLSSLPPEKESSGADLGETYRSFSSSFVVLNATKKS